MQDVKISKSQFEILFSEHKSEVAREAELINRAKIFLSLASVMFLGLIYKLPDLAQAMFLPALIPLGLSAVALAGALVLLLKSLGVGKQRKPFNLAAIGEMYQSKRELTDESFYVLRAADLIKTDNVNRLLINQRGVYLRRAGRCIIAAVLLLTVGIAAQVGHNLQAGDFLTMYDPNDGQEDTANPDNWKDSLYQAEKDTVHVERSADKDDRQ